MTGTADQGSGPGGYGRGRPRPGASVDARTSPVAWPGPGIPDVRSKRAVDYKLGGMVPVSAPDRAGNPPGAGLVAGPADVGVTRLSPHPNHPAQAAS